MKPGDSVEPGVWKKKKETWIFKRTLRFLRSWKKPGDSEEPMENLEIYKNQEVTWRFTRTWRFWKNWVKPGVSEECL